MCFQSNVFFFIIISLYCYSYVLRCEHGLYKMYSLITQWSCIFIRLYIYISFVARSTSHNVWVHLTFQHFYWVAVQLADLTTNSTQFEHGMYSCTVCSCTVCSCTVCTVSKSAAAQSKHITMERGFTAQKCTVKKIT